MVGTHISRRAALAIAPAAMLASRRKALAKGAGRARKDGLEPALQQAVADHLAKRRAAEGITGIVAHISLATGELGIDVAAGSVSRESSAPMRPDTLFQIGSNTKSFTAALLLRLEMRGLCSIDQTVGAWLPQYPAWGDVSIRRLLNMTSGLPTYSEAPRFMAAQVADINREWTPEELIAFAYPGPGNELPPNHGYFYSNTNYILAGMIAAEAGQSTYGDLLRQELFSTARLSDCFYESGGLPEPVLRRLCSGYFENPDCGVYEPDCEVAALAPLVGKDMRTVNLSWAGAAGGIVATPRELATWVRAVFGGAVLRQTQLAEMQRLVSMKTGWPIERTTAEDPAGFSLGFVQSYREPFGRFWFYQGETLGYRAALAWFPEKDLVITLATNSQPKGSKDHIGLLVQSLYGMCVDA